MRVMYVDHSSKVSGGQESLLNIIEKLPADVDPCVVCPSRGGEFRRRIDESRATIIQIPMPQVPGKLSEALSALWYTAFASIKVARLARTLDVDVIYANSFLAGGIGALSRLGHSRPVVTRLRSSLSYKSHGLLDFLIAFGSEVMLANSKYIEDVTREKLGGIGQIVTIYNPISVGSSRVGSEGSKGSSCLSGEEGFTYDNGKTICCVGRITPRKRQEDLVKCLPLVRDRVSHPIRTLFVGAVREGVGDEYYQKLRSLIRAYDVEEECVFTGYRDDVFTLVKNADVFVLPSVHEPMARSLVEAQLLGRPVVAAESGGNVELIEDGRTGWLYPPGNIGALAEKIVKLLTDKEVANMLGTQGRERAVQMFSDANTINKEYRLYQNVLAGKPLNVLESEGNDE